MKEMLKITFNLVVIFVAAGLIVAVVYSVAGPIIANNQRIEEENARKQLMPDAASIPPEGKWSTAEGKHGEYYAAKDSDGKDIGYLIVSYGKGYAGFIKVLVAVNKDMTVKAIKPLSHSETPGLGDELDKAYFQDRFKGKKLDQLEVVKQPDPNKIEAISGATISSRGVTKGVKEGLEYLIKRYQGGADGK